MYGVKKPGMFVNLAGASLLALSSAAHAQSPAPVQGPKQIPVPEDTTAGSDLTYPAIRKYLPTTALAGEDLFSAKDMRLNPIDEGALLLQADEVAYDDKLSLYTASGNVQVTYKTRILVADELTYDQEAGIVRAHGNVSVTDDNGDVIYAGSLEIDDELSQGVIESFSALLAEHTRIAADRAEREANNRNILYRGVYSSCEICDAKGKRKPLWQIKAVRVTHDKDKKIVRYRHAFLEFRGVPILYTPYFAHADPAVARRSGFLVPKLGNSSDLGNFVEIPYYWAISPSYDLTFSPMLLLNEAPVLKGEFRMRTRRGQYVFNASITNPKARDEEGNREPGREVRNHLFAKGDFEVGEKWNWGFAYQHSSDDTYLERYDIDDTDELESRLYAQRENGRNYVSVEGYYFRGLRSKDEQGQTPIVTPDVNFRYFSPQKIFGGYADIEGNTLVLQRTEGSDMRRVSVTGNWHRPHTSKTGHVFNTFGQVRTDVYQLNDINQDLTIKTGQNADYIARVLPTIGAEWRFPLFKQTTRTLQVIEPIAQFIYSSNGGNPETLPNEDSLSFEFDDTNLFEVNKFPGFDRWESGARINYGLNLALYGFGAGENSFLLGQSYRFHHDELFSPSTGLRSKNSDYIGRLKLSPFRYFNLTHRFRLDKDSFKAHRNEVNLFAGNNNYNTTIGYLKLDDELTESGLKEREEMSVNAKLRIYGNWSFVGEARRDLANKEMIRASGALKYEDECTDIEITVRRRFTRDRDIEPSTAVFLRIRLKTLG